MCLGNSLTAAFICRTFLVTLSCFFAIVSSDQMYSASNGLTRISSNEFFSPPTLKFFPHFPFSYLADVNVCSSEKLNLEHILNYTGSFVCIIYFIVNILIIKKTFPWGRNIYLPRGGGAYWIISFSPTFKCFFYQMYHCFLIIYLMWIKERFKLLIYETPHHFSCQSHRYSIIWHEIF